MGGKMNVESANFPALISGIIIRAIKFETTYIVDETSKSKWGYGIGSRFRIADGWSFEISFFKKRIRYTDFSERFKDSYIFNMAFGTTLDKYKSL